MPFVFRVSQKNTMTKKYEYDVCLSLSLAGENRTYVEAVASKLKNRGIQVFYDEWEKAKLWGKNLYEYLSHILQ